MRVVRVAGRRLHVSRGTSDRKVKKAKDRKGKKAKSLPAPHPTASTPSVELSRQKIHLYRARNPRESSSRMERDRRVEARENEASLGPLSLRGPAIDRDRACEHLRR